MEVDHFMKGFEGALKKIDGKIMATAGYSGGAPTDYFCSD
jgi:hypothetical protein